MALSRNIGASQLLPGLLKPVRTPAHLVFPPFKTQRCGLIFHKPFSSRIPSKTILTSEQIEISDALICAFSRRTLFGDNPELQTLAPKLDNKVVETVLTGLRFWKRAQAFFTWASNQYGYRHNMYTYNAMASVLSGARQNAALRVLATEVLDSRCNMTPGALGFFIRCLGSAGLVEEANTLFDQVQLLGTCVHNNYSYNCLLEALSKAGLVDLVEMRVEEMRRFGWSLDKYSLTPLLQVYCNAGDFKRALNVFNELCDRGWVDEHVFFSLVVSFSKWGQVDSACELISMMEERNVTLNEKTFSVLIHGFVRENRVDKALELLEKMCKSGFSPTVSVFDVIIGGLCKYDELEKALSLYSQMKDFGIQVDIGILTNLILSFSGGVGLVKLLDTCWLDMDLDAKKLLCNFAVENLVSNDSVEEAHNLLRSLMGEACGARHIIIDYLSAENLLITPDSNSFYVVINGLIQRGKLDMALALFRDMNRVGCRQTLLLYNNLIDAFCNLNRLEEAYELLQEMKDMGFEPTHFTYNCIYGNLCRTVDVQGSLDLIRKMHFYGHEPWIKNSTLLVKNLCKHGRVEEACKFLADMVQEGLLPHIVPYSAAMNGLIVLEKLDKALELFRGICARGYCPDVVAYNILIKALCKNHRVAEAEDLLNEMILKGLVPSVVSYNALVDGWCKSDNIDKALLCLSQIDRKDMEPNVITYTALIDGLCNDRRPNDALKLWTDMVRRGCFPNRVSFMALINGLCKNNKSYEALGYFHEMNRLDMKPDSYIYLVLIRSLLSDAKPSLAFDILKEMIDKGSLPSPLDKNFAVLREAICKLLEDADMSGSLKNLIEEGKISDFQFPKKSEGVDEPPV